MTYSPSNNTSMTNTKTKEANASASASATKTKTKASKGSKAKTLHSGSTCDDAVDSNAPGANNKNNHNNKRNIYRWLACTALAGTMLVGLVSCPHSKVEESFPLQAVHDLLYHGVQPAVTAVLDRRHHDHHNDNNSNNNNSGILSYWSAAVAATGADTSTDIHTNSTATTCSPAAAAAGGDCFLLPYDHTRFPGVVPRSFAGPYLLALASQVGHWIVYAATAGYWNVKDQHPAVMQRLARFCLLLANLWGYWCFATAVDQRQEQQQEERQQQQQQQQQQVPTNTTSAVSTKSTTAIHTKGTSSSTSTSITSTSNSSMIGTYLLLVTACQFHLPFYASRMLPNTFAVWWTLHCYAFWVATPVPAPPAPAPAPVPPARQPSSSQVPYAAAILVAACVMFRCDMILLLFVTGLSWLFQRHLTVLQAIRIGILSGAVSLLLTVPLDSLLWQKWVWPEGQVFVFNAIQGKSQDWGVLPWHWYWTVALPKALLGTAVTIPLAVTKVMEQTVVWEERYRYPKSKVTVTTTATEHSNNSNSSSSKNSNWMVRQMNEWIDFTWMFILLPALGFCALYSCLGHKETRFLFPVLPLWNLAAAVGLAKVHAAAFGSSSDGGVLLLWSTSTSTSRPTVTTTAAGSALHKKDDDQPDNSENDSSALHNKDDDQPESTDTQLSTSSYYRPSLMGRLIYVGCMGLLIGTLAVSSIFVAVSRWNYPGGVALTTLVQHIQQIQGDATTNQLRVHIDVASAMTGVSLFGQREATVRVPDMEWVFDKAGYEPENAIPGEGGEGDEEDEESIQAAIQASATKWMIQYTHLITEDASLVDPELFRLVGIVQGHPRLDLRGARIDTSDSIYILERLDFLEES